MLRRMIVYTQQEGEEWSILMAEYDRMSAEEIYSSFEGGPLTGGAITFIPWIPEYPGTKQPETMPVHSIALIRISGRKDCKNGETYREKIK